MIQGSKIPSSVISLYISKENIGVAHFDKNGIIMQCGLIKFYIPNTKFEISNLIRERSVELILTNNGKHTLLTEFVDSIKIERIEEKGLQDDIIQNNISTLKFNPIKQQISNKPQYIKFMREHSQSNGLMKEKYKALGMLLYFLLNENEFKITSQLYINDIEYFFDKIFKQLQIKDSELQALEIIKQEVHPSFVKGKGRSKEGFSILGLYQTPLSSAGSKKILRNIFRNPTYDKYVIENRLDMIHWVKQFSYDNKILLKLFRSIHTVDVILNKFSDSRMEDQDWRKFVKTLESIIIIHKIMKEKYRLNEHEALPQFLSDFFNFINWNDLGKVLSAIESTLDLELVDGSVKRGVDLHLDELKKTYDNLPHLLTLYARQQNWGEDFRIVFMSQIGYLIRVPHQLQIPTQFQHQNWNLQFIKNSGKFYCNDLTRMLDEKYGDIYGCISDKEKKIIFELENFISDYFQIIEQAYWKICELQCFVGIAIVSHGMCRPRISSQSLIISNGWHLLLAQDAIQNHAFSFNQLNAPQERVFNSEENLVNTSYSNRMMLISGPNGSGKTIYMKQLAIIIFLAHLGFYVPAQFAEIPLLDKIAFLESKKSIYRGNNGFLSEIVALSQLLTPGLFTNKTLILVDELGASIDNILAKKILIALLTFLCDSNKSDIKTNEQLSKVNDRLHTPLTVAITHLTDTMKDSLMRQSYLLRYLTMDMEKDQISLFKIKPGLVKRGYGIECAKDFMEEQFIKRAQNYWESIKYGE